MGGINSGRDHNLSSTRLTAIQLETILGTKYWVQPDHESRTFIYTSVCVWVNLKCWKAKWVLKSGKTKLYTAWYIILISSRRILFPVSNQLINTIANNDEGHGLTKLK